MIRRVQYILADRSISFLYANKERILTTITNHASEIKFIVVVSSCTSTFGKLKEI